MTAVYWIAGLALVAFELAAGLGKVVRVEMAKEAFDRMGISHVAMAAFGGLELGAVNIVIIGMFAPSVTLGQLTPWAVAAVIGLQLVHLFWLRRAGEPSAAFAGPAFVIAAALLFLLARSAAALA